MATPTMMEFVEALITIERFLKAEAETLKVKFPQYAASIDAVIAKLALSERTLEALTLAWKELQVFTTGNGPVVHKPEDMA